MREQIQCPNCRGYKVDSTGPHYEDPITHKRLGVNSAVGCILPIVIISCGLFIALVQVNFNVQNAVGIAAIAIAIIVWLVARAMKRGKLKQFALTIYYCNCQICGRKFKYTR